MGERTYVTATADSQILSGGVTETCWRGIRIGHPSNWEPGFLAGPGQPTKCALVDRRFQRLEVHWEVLHRRPDLREMYRRLGKGLKHSRPEPLRGAGQWTGLVRAEKSGWIVHAGRFFKDRHVLVQVVLTWPGQRDRALERAVLGGIAPQGDDDPVLWQAFGLSAMVPRRFELAESANKVGRLSWEFRRPGRGGEGLTVERLAMPRYWLKASVGDWLRGELPQGFKAWRELPVTCGGQAGTEIHSRRSNPLTAVARKGVSRLDRAWLCRQDQRVYRVGCWRRASGEIDWPAGLEIRSGVRVKLA